MPLAEAPFPDGHSPYAEADVGWDAVSYSGLQRHLRLSLGNEFLDIVAERMKDSWIPINFTSSRRR